MSNSSVNQSTELITPDVAEEYLTNGVKNRKVTKSRVKDYIADMTKGGWKMTGEPIIFDEKGRLLDGRHRLTACVESGKSFRTTVVRGVDTKNFAFIDSGRSRTAGDVLNADGFEQDKTIAAAIKVIDAIHRLETGVSSGKNRIRWSRRIPHVEILNFARRHKKRLSEAAQTVRGSKASRLFLRPNSVFAALFFVFAKRGGITRARSFFDDLISGENLSSGDPILKLRNYLFEIKGEKGHSYQEICATAIKAWNSWVKGESLNVLVYDKEVEEWPKVEKP